MGNTQGILLSGGLDSIALAYWKRPSHAFTIDYGQNSSQAELNAATEVARRLQMVHHVIHVDCSSLGSGDLAQRPSISIAPESDWWPFRNQLLVTLACMKAVPVGVHELMVGSVKSDSHHVDGTEVFYQHLSELTQIQEGNIAISTPAISLTTQELIKESHVPLSILMWAHSCHTSNQPCMKCRGCSKYLFTLQQLGVEQ